MGQHSLNQFETHSKRTKLKELRHSLETNILFSYQLRCAIKGNETAYYQILLPSFVFEHNNYVKVETNREIGGLPKYGIEKKV